MPHVTVAAAPCAGTDGWAILSEPPGLRDLEDPRYWETSLDRSLRRRGTRRVRGRVGRDARVVAALALGGLALPSAASATPVDLSMGSSGAAVRQLQAKLGVPVDGQFGPQTEAAVVSFQRSHGIPATGLVGPLTRAALGQTAAAAPGTPAVGTTPSTSTTPSTTVSVRTIQQKLGVTVDGVLGPQTRAAIKAFESSHGLPVTGRPDAQTVAALNETGPTTTTPAPTSGSSAASAAVSAALSKVGAPYSYGAVGPSSFDCSGLVMWAFRQAGVTLPHSSYAQYSMGQSVSQIQAGDLVFFNTAGSGASDVGIATSATTAVSATTHGVMTHPIRSGYWGSHFVGARRVA